MSIGAINKYITWEEHTYVTNFVCVWLFELSPLFNDCSQVSWGIKYHQQINLRWWEENIADTIMRSITLSEYREVII